MLRMCDGCKAKDVLDTDQEGASCLLARNGALLAPFCANGAHPSDYFRGGGGQNPE